MRLHILFFIASETDCALCNISAPTGPVNPVDSCIFVAVLYFFCVLYFTLYFYFLLICCVYSFHLLMAQTIILSHFQMRRGVACPIDGRPVTHVDVDGTQLDVEATFCYLVTCFQLVVVAITLLLLAVVRPGASLESCCQSSLQSTSLSRHAARCSQLVFGQLCSMAVRPKRLRPTAASQK